MSEKLTGEHNERRSAPGTRRKTDLPGFDAARETEQNDSAAPPLSLLADPALKGRGNSPVRISTMLSAQRTIGNRALQRALQRTARRDAAVASHTSTPGDVVQSDPLDGPILGEVPGELRFSSLTHDGNQPGRPLQEDGGVGRAGTPLQQAVASPTPYVQREAATPGPPPAPTAQAAPGSFIVEDTVQDPAAGQMKKRDFLAQLRSAVNSAVSEAGTVSSVTATAEVELAFATYSGKDAATLERTIRQQIPEAAGVSSANGYITLIAGRVRQSLKESESKDGQQNKGTLGNIVDAGASLLGGITKLLFKRRDGSASAPEDGSDIQGQLGPGQPLDSRIRSGLEREFGNDFSSVRVHSDMRSASLADNMNARAFTVGRDIAFAPGEYQPGTLVGDALIAHEVAHVAQQGGAAGGASSPGAQVLQKGEGETTQLEEEADTAAVGAMVSLWGGVRSGLSSIAHDAMPRLKSGLRLQRCGKDKSSFKNLTGSDAQSAIDKLKLRIIPLPEKQPAVAGMQIKYFVDPFETQGEFPRAIGWTIQTLTPNHESDGEKAQEPWMLGQRDARGQSVTLEKAKPYRITADVQINEKELVSLSYVQEVTGTDQALDEGLKGSSNANYKQLMDALSKKEQEAGGGVSKDQKTGDSYITTDGDNPASLTAPKQNTPLGSAPPLRLYTYTVKPKQGATQFRWYILLGDPSKHVAKEGGETVGGFKRIQVDGKAAYDLNSTSQSAKWSIYTPDKYIIVCEQFDEKKEKLGEARYAQVVMTTEQEQQLDRIKKQKANMTEHMSSIKPGSEVGVKAVHLDAATGKTTPLSMFVGAPAQGKGVRLVDLTPNIPWQVVFEGAGIPAVFDEFASSNKYPKGNIKVEMPSNDQVGYIGPYSRTIETTADSTLGAASGGFGWASLGLTALAVGLTLTGVGAVAVPYLFVAAAATGAASSGLSIADHIKDAKRSDLQIAIDVANIAASLVGMAALKKTMSTGLSLVQLGEQGKFYIWAQSAADLTSGVLIAADSATEIDKIMSNSSMSPEDKQKAIMGILANVAMVGGMLAYGAKDLNVQSARLEATLGSKALQGLSSEALENLAKLNENTLSIFKNAAGKDELEQVARLAKENPDKVNQLAKEYGTAMVDEIRSKPPGTLEELSASLKRLPPGCFVKGTLVHTPEGPRPIESLQIGDRVVAYESPDETVIATITRTFVRTVSALLDLRVGGATITCSPEHPLWVPGSGWLEASALRPGMSLHLRSGASTSIDSIGRRGGSFTVYNLHVDQTNTYYVSDLGVLVHNKGAARVVTKEELVQHRTDAEKSVTTVEQKLTEAEKNRLAPDPGDGEALADYKRRVAKQHKDDMYKVKKDMEEAGKLSGDADNLGKAADKYDSAAKQAEALNDKIGARLPGEGITATTGKGAKRPAWGNPKSQPAYGHSYVEHGPQRSAQECQGRVDNPANMPVHGQFYDAATIVEAERRAPLTPGIHVVDLGQPIGRVYRRGATPLEGVTRVEVRRSADLTLTTSFPVQ